VAGTLREFIAAHRRIAVLTGAGCSTGSGIPDYRAADGTWKHAQPMSFADFTGSTGARRRYWAGSLRGWPRVRDAAPNAAHRALARLEDSGRVRAVVTQNVDGLHQKAGSRRVVDLHGRLDTVECLGCGARADREDIQGVLAAWNPGWRAVETARPDGDAPVAEALDGFRVPDCRECGGVLKPAVVFFGENVPRSRASAATAAVDDADALLVVGSSLMVYSGYRLVLAAQARGIPAAAVNIGRTRADDALAFKVEDDCATVLGGLEGAAS
jgi:NAD-dependent SIR2 family protein deacetylase